MRPAPRFLCTPPLLLLRLLLGPPADGTVAYNDQRGIPLADSPYDGSWHMATVSSQPGGGRGYLLYLDGALVNEVAEGGSSLVSPEGFPIPVGGWFCGWLRGLCCCCCQWAVSTARSSFSLSVCEPRFGVERVWASGS